MTPRVRWTQETLGPILPKLIKAELTLHYDGPKGQLDAGYRVRAVVEEELLAMGAIPLRGPGIHPRPLLEVVEFLDQLVHTHLAPF